jgi:4-amino-4-deoxy-L-arabinose transferase-like glycosyltransferase
MMFSNTTVQSSSADRTADRRFWTALAVLTVGRLLYLLVQPLDLVGDEAYYWDWGRHPAWGYFSKPPLIAWLMVLVTHIGGANALAIRIAALVLGTGTLILARQLARDIYGSEPAFWAVAAMALTPGNTASNFIFTIDAPLLFFWCASLLCLWRACLPGPHRLLWALLLVPATGLGLLSKQMMIVFPLLALVFFATDRELRRRLARPWPWLGLAAALAFLAPVLVWNSRHDWITFTHTAHHFAGRSWHPLEMASRLLAFAGGQMGLTSPILWVLLIALFVTCTAAFLRLRRPERFLFLFSGPAIMVMLLMTLRQRMNGNWAAVFYPAGFILLAGWAEGRFQAGTLSPRLRRWFRPGIAVGAALALVAYLLPFVIPHTGLAGTDLDPTRRLRGWSALGTEIGRVHAAMPDPRRTFIVTLGHRYTTSQLAFYTPSHPPVYRWANRRIITTQYELWPGPGRHVGWSALVVIPDRDRALPPALRRRFDRVDPPVAISVPIGPDRRREYTVYPVHGLNTASWKGDR